MQRECVEDRVERLLAVLQRGACCGAGHGASGVERAFLEFRAHDAALLVERDARGDQRGQRNEHPARKREPSSEAQPGTPAGRAGARLQALRAGGRHTHATASSDALWVRSIWSQRVTRLRPPCLDA